MFPVLPFFERIKQKSANALELLHGACFIISLVMCAVVLQ